MTRLARDMRSIRSRTCVRKMPKFEADGTEKIFITVLVDPKKVPENCGVI